MTPDQALAQLNRELEGEPAIASTFARMHKRAAELGLGPVRWDALSRLVVRTDAAPGRPPRRGSPVPVESNV